MGREAHALADAAASLAGPADPAGAPSEILAAVHGYNAVLHYGFDEHVTAALVAAVYPRREVQHIVHNSVTTTACLTFLWSTNTWSTTGGGCHAAGGR
jgi:hypothetical protein